ncbi:MAG: extracellular solute-binding protein [Atopostipes suicloacalis]|nr:extracellular solute-binding protein [Atopostipes suicloacalis]MDN6730558.1 extracellular solute-binding protein [Atopostipes suicloacalis]
MKDRIEDFKAENEGTDYNIELGVVGEPDARDVVTQDLDAAADVFAFANDQITDLHEAGALYEITKNKDEIVSRNVEGSVEAAMIDDSLYAYPMTADNGYFMYYDSSVFSEEDVDSLDRMIEVAEEEGRKIFFDVANGWYNASFFLGAGNTIEIDEEGVQKVDFNNEQGVKAGNFIRDFTASDAFIGGDDEVLTSQESIAAGVSGTWNAGAMQDKFGENYAATKLPTMNLDGEEKQMASFGGYKLMGVKTSTEHPLEAMALAEFLTNEESQIMRFETRELGPSNIKAAEAEAVQENIALSALAEQSEYAVSQQNVLGSFWEPAEAFGTAMIDGSDEDMQALLDEMVSQINSSNE